MATACADLTDFKTDGGLLKLRTHYAQTPAASFAHVLDGPQNTFEEITELGELDITVPGFYEVTFDAQGNATNTSAAPGAVVATTATAALFRNGALVPNTETMLQLNSQGSSTVDQPALQMRGTGSATQVVQLAAGDKLTVWGKRNSDPGTTTEIVSNSNGRTRITAVRIGGV